MSTNAATSTAKKTTKRRKRPTPLYSVLPMIDAETGQMKVTTRPAERSSVGLEVEFPADRVRRQIDESVRHLARRTEVDGSVPVKVRRPLLERALGVHRDDPNAENPIY